MQQDITRTGARYTTGVDQWTQDGNPVAVHIRIDDLSAELLEIAEGEAAFAVECPLIHETSGTRALHRMILPMERITGTPLAKNAAVSVAKAYAILATANGELEWRETVGARMPQPDERATLHLPEAVPLLIAHRLTLTQAEHRPLILETTSLGAGQAQFAYSLHVSPKPRAARANPREPRFGGCRNWRLLTQEGGAGAPPGGPYPPALRMRPRGRSRRRDGPPDDAQPPEQYDHRDSITGSPG
jgi:GntR family transcriptional regulator